MPIVDIITHGDMKTPGSFQADDLRFIMSDKARAKTVRMLAKTSVPIVLHYVNRPEPILNTASYFEGSYVGHLTSGVVRAFVQEGISKSSKALTLLLVENEGQQRLPLTPWMVSHRLSHALGINFARQPDAKKMHEDFERTISNVTRLYRCDESYIYSADMAIHFGTTRACRMNLITRLGEWGHDCFSQYCVTGQIKFKPTTRTISHKDKLFSLSDRFSEASIDHTLTELADRLSESFRSQLTASVGKIVVL